MRRIIFLYLFSLAMVYPASCNKLCIECKLIMPIIKASAKEINRHYNKTQKDVLKYYKKKILKPLKKKNGLIRLLQRTEKKMEILDDKTAKILQEIELSQKKIKYTKKRIED